LAPQRQDGSEIIFICLLSWYELNQLLPSARITVFGFI